MAKSKIDKDEIKILVGYACVTALVVLLMMLILLEFGYFDAEGSTGFVPNCVPVDIVCGNTGCKASDTVSCGALGCKGDDTIVNGRVQEQYP